MMVSTICRVFSGAGFVRTAMDQWNAQQQSSKTDYDFFYFHILKAKGDWKAF